MSDSISMRDRYFTQIDQIVEITLKGQIRSKEQVYQMLVQNISMGTGEIFESCLAERLQHTQTQIDTQKDELKQAKSTRILRALKTIEGEYSRWQKDHKISDAIAIATQEIMTATNSDRLTAIFRAIDPNQPQALNLDQLKQLTKNLQHQLPQITNPKLEQDVQQIIIGITRGIEAWHHLEPHLVSWIYDQSRGAIGFTGTPDHNGPWSLWSKQVNSPFPQALFNAIAINQSISEFAAAQTHIEPVNLVELAVILQCLQRGLVAWFDQLIYDSKVGAKLSISTFITFAAIWAYLANGFNYTQLNTSDRNHLTNGCFQITLQVLRAFAQREYFPLYGGTFASFTGTYLRDALNYLDAPLRQAEGTQEKARILTLLGYSQRAQGNYEQSIAFHQQALDIARNAGDRICEIANLNHFSRTYIAQKQYEEAINYSQRALIYARQIGEQLGEANALVNLGYSEVLKSQQLEIMEPEIYQTAINHLEQGLQLSEKLGDRQSQALGLSSLGIARVLLDQPEIAIEYLTKGWETAQYSGDLYLQGLNMTYLAEAYYRQQNQGRTIYTASLGMYLLEQIGAIEWRQAAGLLVILQRQMGQEAFQKGLAEQRSQIMMIIGVDGYDYLPELLNKY